MKTEVITITPKMASELLLQNSQNRKINISRVDSYADEMKNGKWLLTHQGLAFFEDGELADGQHRLAAIVKSGCAIEMNVTRGMSKDSSIMIDSHQKRDVYQSIQMSGVKWIGKTEVAIIKMILQMEHGFMSRATNQQVVDFGAIHKDRIQFATSLSTTSRRGLTSAIVLSAMVCASYHESNDDLRAFFDVLLSGMARSPKDRAAILIRDWLLNTPLRGGQDRVNALKRTMRAIMAFCQKQEISRLHQPDEYLYLVPKSN